MIQYVSYRNVYTELTNSFVTPKKHIEKVFPEKSVTLKVEIAQKSGEGLILGCLDGSTQQDIDDVIAGCAKLFSMTALTPSAAQTMANDAMVAGSPSSWGLSNGELVPPSYD